MRNTHQIKKYHYPPNSKKEGGRKIKNQKVALNVEVKNLETITEKTNELLETLRKAKTLIDELAFLGIEIQIND